MKLYVYSKNRAKIKDHSFRDKKKFLERTSDTEIRTSKINSKNRAGYKRIKKKTLENKKRSSSTFTYGSKTITSEVEKDLQQQRPSSMAEYCGYHEQGT